MRLALVLTVLFAFASVAEAAKVVTTDGLTFVGEVVRQNEKVVVLDTKLGDTRATLTFPRTLVKSLVPGPVPRGFFDEPAPDPRVSKPANFSPTDQLYLEVPIRGAFGTQVVTSALKKTLRYAKRHRIRRVVFVIDSAGWNDLDEARRVYKLLRSFGHKLTFHALVKQATGDALAVLMNCDSVHLLPGARVGGAAWSTEGDDADARGLVRQNIARNAARAMRARGRSGLLVQAMIDEAVELACWRADGKLQFGSAPPKGLPAKALIFHCRPGTALVIEAAQAKRLGVKTCAGTSKLGEGLGLSNWKAESDYGTRTMRAAGAKAGAKATQKQARFQRKVHRLLSRRDAVHEELQHAIRNAAKWDPSKGSYETYKRYQWWGWGWGGEQVDTNYLTKSSAREWTQRSFLSMKYLKKAGKAVRTLITLERQAVALGLDPLYKAGELKLWRGDLKAKFEALKNDRNRKER